MPENLNMQFSYRYSPQVVSQGGRRLAFTGSGDRREMTSPFLLGKH